MRVIVANTAEQLNDPGRGQREGAEGSRLPMPSDRVSHRMSLGMDDPPSTRCASLAHVMIEARPENGATVGDQDAAMARGGVPA